MGSAFIFSLVYLPMSKKISFILLVLLILGLSFSSCRKNNPLYSLDDLQGEWIRIQSNKPFYDSMVVNVEESIARIENIRPNNYFGLGDIKWRQIAPNRDSVFSYEELASDGNYYSGIIILSKNIVDSADILFVFPELSSGENGDEQIWIRR
jgi:hypothetical protein